MKTFVLISALLLLTQLVGVEAFSADEPFERRLQDQFSLRPPFFLVGGRIPGWDTEGDTVVTDDFVRLTPDEQSRRGALWSDQSLQLESGAGFEIELSVRIGNSKSLGADGMAFWYVSPDHNRQVGPAMGGQAIWKGVGVIMDTFDNDGNGGQPSIQVLWNDGSWIYTPNNDGTPNQLGACRAFFRNNQEDTRVRITYFDAVLRVQYMGGSLGTTWVDCVQETVGDLHANGKIGFTAATGGLSDNHDVVSVRVAKLLRKGGDRQAELETLLQDARVNAHREREEHEAAQKAIGEKKAAAEAEASAAAAAAASAAAAAAAAAPPPPVNSYVPPPPANAYVPPPPANAYVPPPPAASDAAIRGLMDIVNRIETSLSGQQAKLQQLQNQMQSIESRQTEIRSSVNSLANTAYAAAAANGNSNAAGALAGLDEKFNGVSNAVESARSFLDNNLEQKLSTLRNQLQVAINEISAVRGIVDATRGNQARLEQTFQNVGSSSSSSGGWVTLAIVIQVLLVGVFMFWKKWREEKNKKLF